MQQQLSYIDQQAREKKIRLAEAQRRRKEVYQSYNKMTSYEDAYFESTIRTLDLYDRGKISKEEARASLAEARALLQSRRSLAQIQKNTNCISTRQRVSNSDYSGLNSTSGAVAIISLLSVVADTAAVASACD